MPRKKPLTALLAALALLALSVSGTAEAQSYQVLHYFNGGADGESPLGGLTMDSNGTLYGTTAVGGESRPVCGQNGCGTVFKLTPGASGWTIQHLHEFGVENDDGFNPIAGVIFGPSGNLYGTTFSGGSVPPRPNGPTYGTVYELIRPPSNCSGAPCSWEEKVIHRFHGDDGYAPGYCSLSVDSAGNLYDTTWYGGYRGLRLCGANYGCGVAYRLTKSGDDWMETVLHEFRGGDGYMPSSGLIFDASGNLYGETEYALSPAGYCGPNGCAYGLVYELSPSDGGWQETVLYEFGVSGGAYPRGGLVFDPSGNLYGVGGLDTGEAFELTPSGLRWTFSILAPLHGSPVNCQGLVRDAAGNFYGINGLGGAYGNGNVFKLTATGSGWAYTSLHDFTGLSDGRYPEGAILLGSDGNLYGTTANGGDILTCNPPLGCGVVFKIVP